MTRVDLDELERAALEEGAGNILDAVAELRAARKVVAAGAWEARGLGNLSRHASLCVCRLCRALTAYDQAVNS